MLKNKSLGDFDCVNDEQLFSELTPEEGAAVSGGNFYTFDNRSSATFKPQFNGVNYQVAPLSKLTLFSAFPQAGIVYDNKIGPGYELASLVITPGETSIDETLDRRFIVVPPQVAGVPGGVAPAAATIMAAAPAAASSTAVPAATASSTAF